MAHSGLWGFGLASVALVAAGVWLKMDEGDVTPGNLRAAPDQIASAPVAARPETGRQSAPGTGPEPVRERLPETQAPIPVATQDERPSPTVPQAEDPADAQPAPLAMKPATGSSAQAPLAPPTPDPPPTADLTADPAAAEASARPSGAGDAGDPVIYRGPAVWQDVLARGFESGPLDDLRAQARAAFPQGGWFGAAAAAPSSTAAVAVQGFASLAGAENAAMQVCAAARDGCRVIAHLVPQDFDDRRTGTTSLAQGAVWAIFRIDPPRPEAPHRALAIAMDGGAAWADAANPDTAGQRALRRCRAAQALMGHPDGTPPVRCQIVARRGP